MSITYKILIPETEGQRIGGWDIPSSIRTMMEARLREDLETEPSKHIKAALAPWGERPNLYSPIVVNPDVPHETYIFTFHMLYGEDGR